MGSQRVIFTMTKFDYNYQKALRFKILFLNLSLNLTQNDLCATSNKNMTFNISKNLLHKVGISNSLCSRTV